MTCRMSVVKLGGGVITVKSSPETVDYESLGKAVVQLAEYRRSGGLLALVHGGGSFGHVAVARILREKGFLSALDSSIVQESMLKLAMAVVRTLREHGLNPSLHPPHSICLTPDPKECDVSVIARDLRLGLTPVTFGDIIPVEGGEAKVVSGDDLAAEIASRLKADCLVYVIREPGVLEPGGHVIPLLTSIDQLSILASTRWDDVTGGIRRKVEVALGASRSVERVIITNTENLLKALRGDPVGTRVKYSEY